MADLVRLPSLLPRPSPETPSRSLTDKAMTRFFLLTDTKFLYCFLVDKWLREFAHHPGFGGVLVRAEPPDVALDAARRAFHDQHHGQRQLSSAMDETLGRLYPDFGTESRAAIARFGVPRHGFCHAERAIYLGANLNGDKARAWVAEHLAVDEVWVFSHVGQILAPWWIEHSRGRLLNMHSAVLPFARGANAVQQIAALADEVRLRQVAGATIHYIDEGVDTGALIRAERLSEPLAHTDLWDLVAAIYDLGDSLYVRTARDIIEHPGRRPVGFRVAAEDQGPNFLRRDFSPQRRVEAEQGFATLRATWQARQAH